MIGLRFFPLKSADARGAGTRDEPLRTSAWEATELRSERGFSNYVRQVDWQPRDTKFTRSPGARNISRALYNLF